MGIETNLTGIKKTLNSINGYFYTLKSGRKILYLHMKLFVASRKVTSTNGPSANYNVLWKKVLED